MSTSVPSSRREAIIVGSGLAGLSASSQLISHGIPVHLLERSPRLGGNSIKASSGINGAPTKYQPLLPSGPDTSFYSDTFKSAGSVVEIKKEQRENLISTLTIESANAVDWLVKKGIDLSVVAQLGGHSFPRTHRGAGKLPPGAAIVATLLKSLQASPLFKLQTDAIVIKALQSPNGTIEGVHYSTTGEEKQLNGPVIFTTGGFAGDSHGMLAQYRPDLAGLPSTNDPRPGSQHLLTAIGAQLLDMQEVQIHPTAFIDPKDPRNRVKFLAAEMLRGEGGILLSEGKRFVNELERRKVVTERIMGLEGKEENGVRQWDVQLMLDEGAYGACKNHMDFYLWKGLMRKSFIAELSCPSESLATIRQYASSISTSSAGQFSRSSFGKWNLKPEDIKPETVVYMGNVTPAVHFTMGGVVINEDSQVLNANGKEIEGLWAAGEVTGGVHGENRLGGSSLLECVVFGRRAGEGAAKFLLGEGEGRK